MTDHDGDLPLAEEEPRRHRNWFAAMMASGDRGAFLMFAVLGLLLLLFWAGMMQLRSEGLLITTGITLGIPSLLGLISGLLAKSSRVLTLFGISWVLVGAVIAVLMTGEIVGVFCAFVYAVIAWPWAFVVGLMVMWWRRWRRGGDNWSKTDLTVFALLLGWPLAMQAVETIWPAVHSSERLVATREIDAPAAAVWRQGLHFETTATSPWQSVAAPLPAAADGQATQVGDQKTIRFAKGVIRLRITEVEPGRRLLAQVLEQTIERNAARLQTVELRCEALGPERCRAQVEIRFEPRMSPRWYWRPFERLFGGLPIDAVLDDWQHLAEQAPRSRQ